jgi:hypothetical protein
VFLFTGHSSGECTALSALEHIRDAVDVRESRRRPGRRGVRPVPSLRGGEESLSRTTTASCGGRPRVQALQPVHPLHAFLYTMLTSLCVSLSMLPLSHSLSYGALTDDIPARCTRQVRRRTTLQFSRVEVRLVLSSPQHGVWRREAILTVDPLAQSGYNNYP